MKKMPTLYVRELAPGKEHLFFATPIVEPECMWVIEGEGIATEKFDGSCTMVRDNRLYRRFDAKPGRRLPAHFEPCEPAPTDDGHWHGWIPVEDTPDNQWHMEAWQLNDYMELDGTYELVGPKVQNNPYDMDYHDLWRHGSTILEDVPVTFGKLGEYLADVYLEGVVWHHPDGRMAKIKRRDFGIRWPDKTTQVVQDSTIEPLQIAEGA